LEELITEAAALGLTKFIEEEEEEDEEEGFMSGEEDRSQTNKTPAIKTIN
jgi:hypothetical protein